MMEFILNAIKILNDGALCAIPTETVYGLAAKACESDAVAKIYALKKRPSFNPLIVHVSSFQQIEEFAHFSSFQRDVCETFWSKKKSLTVVLSLKSNNLSPLVTAGLNTVAVRLPHHEMSLKIIESTGPLAAPSANVSNSISPTMAEHVRQSFKDEAPFIVDGGPCVVGLESTIIDLSCTEPTLLRPGGVSLEELEAYFGKSIRRYEGTIKAPGMTKKHYSPGCPVILNCETLEEGDVFLGFGPNALNAAINLSPSGNLVEAASNLFKALHNLSLLNPRRIVVSPIPKEGLGLAINDRLERAA